MARITATVFFVLALFSVCWSAEQSPLNNQKDKDSYSLGYTFGSNIGKQEFDLNVDVLLQAMRDALEHNQPAMSADEIRETMSRLQEKMRLARVNREKEAAAKNLEEGKVFLEKNKNKEGFKTLPDGLQYKVLTEGAGPSPNAKDNVTVNYRGTLLDGTLFDSSYTRGKPTNLRVDGVIKGWTEALQLMKTGSKWEVVVPSELAYGAKRSGRIPPNSTLIFEIELLSIGKEEPPKAPGPNQAPGANPE